eukprot:952641-Pelagomonas_calceolata.AAC.3
MPPALRPASGQDKLYCNLDRRFQFKTGWHRQFLATLAMLPPPVNAEVREARGLTQASAAAAALRGASQPGAAEWGDTGAQVRNRRLCKQHCQVLRSGETQGSCVRMEVCRGFEEEFEEGAHALLGLRALVREEVLSLLGSGEEQAIDIDLVGAIGIDLAGAIDIDLAGTIDIDLVGAIDVDLVGAIDIDLAGAIDIDLVGAIDIDLVGAIDIDLAGARERALGSLLMRWSIYAQGMAVKAA